MQITKRILFITSFMLLVILLFHNMNREDISMTQVNSVASDTKNTEFKIPQKIHQYIPSKKMTKDMKQLTESWVSNNPNYDLILHDEHDVAAYFESSLNKLTFSKLTPKEKILFFKLCYIYEYGGVWVNHNLKCEEPIPILEDTDMMVTLDENYYSQFKLSDSFFAFKPKSDLLNKLITTIKHENKILPSYFSSHYNDFFKSRDITKFNVVINDNYTDYSLSSLPMILMGKQQQKIVNNKSVVVRSPSFNYEKHASYGVVN